MSFRIITFPDSFAVKEKRRKTKQEGKGFIISVKHFSSRSTALAYIQSKRK